MIVQQLERVLQSKKLSKLVVATSQDSSDDELVSVLEAHNYNVYRGSLEDVLDRFVQASEKFQPKNIVRITADCPLISPKVIDRVIEAFEESGNDYLSNTMKPTFPDGLDVEVVSSKVLKTVSKISTDLPEREHVTLGVYRRDQQFSIGNYADAYDNSNLRWTVDTTDDFEFVKAIYRELYPIDAMFEFEDILQFLRNHPELNRTTDDAKRNAALDGLDTGAMNA